MSDRSNMWEDAARNVIDADTDDFADLVRLSGLDIHRHLRFQRYTGFNFSNCDLRSYDFTGARLIGCNFSGAQITGARFDQAEIDNAGDASNALTWGGTPLTWGREQITWDDSLDDGGVLAKRNPLRAAADWDAYVAGWRRPERLARDRHLPVGAVLQDAPFGPELVVIPPGKFMMGSPDDEPGRDDYEGPRREVTIGQAFAVGRYAVTFDEWDFAQADEDWRKITKLKPREANDSGWGRGHRPVIDVSWKDARAYAKWLSAKTGQKYRLLSEAEWEYCCRAGTQTPFWWGSAITPAQANYDGNYVYGGGEKGEYRKRTMPVDAFAPNPWGLYQMHGNVWEWVEDVWHESYGDAPNDGSAWTAGDGRLRVFRGGSWFFNPQSLRAAYRFRVFPDDRSFDIGFRVSRTLNL